MELNDNEFDAAFRKRVFDADPQFEEEAWNKMEKKLRRRDHVVFVRKAVALCLLLLIGFAGYLIVDKGTVKNTTRKMVKNDTTRPVQPGPENRADKTSQFPETGNAVPGRYKAGPLQVLVPGVKTRIDSALDTTGGTKVNGVAVDRVNQLVPNTVLAETVTDSGLTRKDSVVTALSGSDVLPASVSSIVKKKKSLPGRTVPLSLSLSLGPEFNSSGSVLGGKRGFSAGVGLSVGIAKRVTLHTGLRYSAKDYAADSYEYQFKNAKIKDVIAQVDASCAVLEIPLQASYTLLDGPGKSIDVNLGISSYFMLKEDYTYRYTAGSGIEDRFQEYRNRNQHYFGVADLSATYYIKLKKEKFRLGLEPYIKIPLTGVGEGRVNLKSSGVSLKLRYDLGKKNN